MCRVLEKLGVPLGSVQGSTAFITGPKGTTLTPAPKESGIGFSREDRTRLFLSGKVLRKEEAYVT